MARRMVNPSDDTVDNATDSFVFDSVEAFTRWAAGPADPSYIGKRRTGSRSSKRGSALGTETWKEAVALAATGDVEGAARIEKLAARLRVTSSVMRPMPVRSKRGGRLSMAAYLSGHPAPYVKLTASPAIRDGRGPVVRIVVNASASYMVTTSVLARRGAAIVALAEAIEKSGRRVEIETVIGVKGRGTGRAVFRIMVKRADRPINLPHLSFAIAHPAFLRRFGFSATERLPEGMSRYGGSYGMPADVPIPEGSLYFGRMLGGESDWVSDDRAVDYVRRTAEEYGVAFR